MGWLLRSYSGIGPGFGLAHFNPQRHGGHRDEMYLFCALMIVFLGRERRFAFPIHTTSTGSRSAKAATQDKKLFGLLKDCADLVVPILV